MPFNAAPRKQTRPPESRSDQQTKYLAGIVYDLIAEFGIENVTMRQVAEAAQVSLGTITYHFRSKQNLISAALAAGYELPADWDQYKGSAVAQLRRIALSYAFESPNSRWWRFWVNYVAMSTRDKELQASQSKRFDKQRRFWIKLLMEAKQKAEILADTPVEDVVDEMLTQVHGLVILQILKPTPKMRAHAYETINKMVDRLLISPPDRPDHPPHRMA